MFKCLLLVFLIGCAPVQLPSPAISEPEKADSPADVQPAAKPKNTRHWWDHFQG